MGCIGSQVDSRPNLFERNLCLHHMVPVTDVYSIVGEIGRGAFGVVNKVEHKITKVMYAMKTLKCAKGTHRSELEREMDILRGLYHPNIVRMVETYEDDNQFYIIMEICSAGTLLNLVQKRGKELPEIEVREIIRKLALVVQYLHTRFICHRDLKLENILIEAEELGGELKLSDFGASTLFKMGESMKKVLGSVVYMAPEVLDGNYKESCDLWSLGVIMYMLLSNRPPFHGSTEDELIEKIYEAKLDFSEPVWSTVSRDAKALLRKMLDPDPNSRYTAERVLAHSWIQADVQPVPDAVYDEFVPRLQMFGHYSPFRRAALVALAFCLPSSAIRKHAEVYNELNVAHNGFLTLEELKEAQALERFNISWEPVFQALDQQGDGLGGSINLLEFAAATLDVNEVCNDEMLRRAYFLFNPGKNDGITHEDLLALLGQHFDTAICKEMISFADADKDGKVGYNDFALMMKTAMLRCKKSFRRRYHSYAESPADAISQSSTHIDVYGGSKSAKFFRRRSLTPRHAAAHDVAEFAAEETAQRKSVESTVTSREEAVRHIQSLSLDVKLTQSLREGASTERGESTASMGKISVVVANAAPTSETLNPPVAPQNAE